MCIENILIICACVPLPCCDSLDVLEPSVIWISCPIAVWQRLIRQVEICHKMRSTRRMKFPSEQATGLQRGDTQSQTAKNTKISCALPQKIGPRMLNVMVLACILSRLSYPYASQQVLLLIHVDTMINDRESEMLLCFFTIPPGLILWNNPFFCHSSLSVEGSRKALPQIHCPSPFFTAHVTRALSSRFDLLLTPSNSWLPRSQLGYLGDST
jgi:hypothetical protein